MYNYHILELFINDKVYFMNKNEVAKFFKDDSDNYVKNLSNLDIIALKSSSKDDYINKSISDISDFTFRDKSILIDACNKADKFLSTFNGEKHINFKKIADMNWKLAKTEGKWYEAGYPHTRQDIIFITPDVINHKEVVRIMIHEKIHVFERLFPNEILEWMNMEGYTPYKNFKDYPMGRSNPDLNGIVYKDKFGNETIALFKNMNPKGIDDSYYPGGKDWKYEHPYETLAYKVDYAYAGEKFSS